MIHVLRVQIPSCTHFFLKKNLFFFGRIENQGHSTQSCCRQDFHAHLGIFDIEESPPRNICVISWSQDLVLTQQFVEFLDANRWPGQERWDMDLLEQDVETPSSWFREWPSSSFEGPVLKCPLKNHAPGRVLCLVNGKGAIGINFYSQQSSLKKASFSQLSSLAIFTIFNDINSWNQDPGCPISSLEFSPCSKVSPPFFPLGQTIQVGSKWTSLIWG